MNIEKGPEMAPQPEEGSQEMPEPEEKTPEREAPSEPKKETPKTKERPLSMPERFARERDELIRHFMGAFLMSPEASTDPKEIRKGVLEQIEERGLFVPTESERERYEDPGFTEGALEDTIRRFKQDTVRDIIEAAKEIRKQAA